MSIEIFSLAILGAIVVAQSFWINTLINKLMSRNYYDYEITKKLTKPNDNVSNKELRIPAEETGDDLGYLTGLG